MTDTISFEGQTPREFLTTALSAQFPGWLVVPSERVPDTLDRPALVIKQRSIQPHEAAPLSHYNVGFYVTVVDDHTDFQFAEDALDTNVLLVWTFMSASKAITPKTATKALFNSYMSYDIEADLMVQKG